MVSMTLQRGLKAGKAPLVVLAHRCLHGIYGMMSFISHMKHFCGVSPARLFLAFVYFCLAHYNLEGDEETLKGLNIVWWGFFRHFKEKGKINEG